jgi:lipopolysaccharide/colanic/teichoic acid biosynthesis glycosyltransferase
MARRSAQLAAKRALDVGLAALGLAVAAPVMAVTAGAIWATMGRPVVFRQIRPGLGGRPIQIMKFRTMRPPDGAPDPDPTREAERRVTPLGRFLRRTALDELPQLWTVLRGDMSLVGPRPLLTEYLPNYTGEQARRHDVMPGITGWAQIHGRQDTPFSEKLRHDVWYVDHWSFWLDLQILARTVATVLRLSGDKPAPGVDDVGLSSGTGGRAAAGSHG